MKKRILTLMLAIAALLALAVPVFAAGDDVSDIMSAGLDTVKTDVLSMIKIALPAALVIFAMFFGVRKAIAMLRGVAK